MISEGISIFYSITQSFNPLFISQRKKLMKKLLLILLTLPLAQAFAQYRPQHTQYLLNNYLINPAITGIEEYVDVQTGFRSQWNGVEGGPRTLQLSVHGAVSGNGRYPGLNQASVDNDAPLSRVNTYRRPRAHHGLGGTLMSDRVGAFARQEIQLSYAYHLPVSRTTTVSMGVAGGWLQQRFNEGEAILTNPDDPALRAGLHNFGRPLLSVGVWAYGAKAYLGASFMQVMRSPNAPEATAGDVHRHAYVTAGYRLALSRQLALQPSALLRLSQQNPLAYDVSLRAILQQRVWLGVAYRSSQEVSVLAGFHMNELLSVGYAYDTSTGRFSRYSSGSHEVVLNLRLANRRRDLCPQQLW